MTSVKRGYKAMGLIFCSVIFIATTLIAEVLLERLLIHTAV